MRRVVIATGLLILLTVEILSCYAARDAAVGGVDGGLIGRVAPLLPATVPILALTGIAVFAYLFVSIGPRAIVTASLSGGLWRRTLPFVVFSLGALGVASGFVGSGFFGYSGIALLLLPPLLLLEGGRALRGIDGRPFTGSLDAVWHFIALAIGVAGLCAAWTMVAHGLP